MRGGFMHRVNRETEEFSLRALSARARRLFVAYLKGYWRQLILASLAMLLVTGSVLGGPIKIAVDRFIRHGNLQGLNLFLGAYLLLYLVARVSWWPGSCTMSRHCRT